MRLSLWLKGTGAFIVPEDFIQHQCCAQAWDHHSLWKSGVSATKVAAKCGTCAVPISVPSEWHSCVGSSGWWSQCLCSAQRRQGRSFCGSRDWGGVWGLISQKISEYLKSLSKVPGSQKTINGSSFNMSFKNKWTCIWDMLETVGIVQRSVVLNSTSSDLGLGFRSRAYPKPMDRHPRSQLTVPWNLWSWKLQSR